MRVRSLPWIVSLAAGGFVCLGIGPALPVLLRERGLADDVRRLAEVDVRSQAPRGVRKARDPDLRRKTQALARARGFLLPLDGVVIGYARAPDDDPFEVPERIGYTLPISLPLFGFLPVAFLAVRAFDVPP